MKYYTHLIGRVYTDAQDRQYEVRDVDPDISAVMSTNLKTGDLAFQNAEIVELFIKQQEEA